MRALKFATAGIVALSLVLTGCGGSTTATSGSSSQTAEALPQGVTINAAGGEAFKRNDAVDGGTLRLGMNAPAETLDPAAPVGTGPLPIMRAVFDALFVYDEKGAVIPELAKSIETKDNGKTWTLKLPTGINFTDGTPFNSAAVVAHVTRLAAEGSRSRSAGDARNIASMATPDAATVEFTLKNATMLFPKLMTAGVYGAGSMIPSPTAVAKYGKDFGAHIVGVGPFVLDSFKAGGEITVKKNPNYRIKGQPHLDSIVYVPATDTQSRLSAAIAGDIDLASTQSAPDLREATNSGLVSVKQPDFTYYDLLFNLSKAPFDNVKFRKAVIQAIDLDGLNEAVFDGLQTPMKGLFPEANPFYIEAGFPEYNLEDAKKLVEEYVKETGNKAEFTMTTTSPPEFQKQAQVMQQMLKDAGITMNLNVGDQPTMITEALSGNYQAQHRYIGVSVEVSQTLRNDFYSKSPANNSQGGNPKFDALLDKLPAAKTTEERKDIYEDLQKEFSNWLPIVPLIAHQNGWYLGKKVGGFPGATPASTEPDVRELWIAG